MNTRSTLCVGSSKMLSSTRRGTTWFRPSLKRLLSSRKPAGARRAANSPAKLKRTPWSIDSVNGETASSEAQRLSPPIEIITQIRLLGAREPRRLAKTTWDGSVQTMADSLSPKHVVHLFEQSRIRSDWIQRYLGSESAFLDPTKFAELHFHLAGYAMTRPTFQRLGLFMHTVAAEMGNLESALALCQIEALNNRNAAPASAHALVEEAASTHRDWQAMASSVERMLRTDASPAAAFKTYEKARTLFDMTEAGQEESPAMSPLDQFEAPWRLLWRSATAMKACPDRNVNLADVDKCTASAIQEGARSYHDPDACAELASHPTTVVYSDTWLELQTKAAMAGKSQACFELGKYYLERDGWYPSHGRKKITTTQLYIGFEWLELSACLSIDTPELSASRFLASAIVLRENGHAEAGRDFLKRGIIMIETEAVGSQQTTETLRKLKEYDEMWEFNVNVEGALPNALLGPSQMRMTASS